ncbi:MAG: energy transducer TonB, partial [Balneolaceae bacterium]
SNIKQRINMIKAKKTNQVPFKASINIFFGVMSIIILMMSCTDLQSEKEPTIHHSEIDMKEAYNEMGDYFVVTEQMPELIGGLSGVQENLKYPGEAKKAGLEGRVYIQFIVNSTGEVEDPKVIRGIDESLDEAALEAVKQARFHPGLIRGNPVRVQYSLPIVFQLESSSGSNGV